MKKPIQHNDKYGKVLEVGTVPEERVAPGVTLTSPSPVAVDLETFRRVVKAPAIEEVLVVEVPTVEEVPAVGETPKVRKKASRPKASPKNK